MAVFAARPPQPNALGRSGANGVGDELAFFV
jgi:hypothetical protein